MILGSGHPQVLPGEVTRQLTQHGRRSRTSLLAHFDLHLVPSCIRADVIKELSPLPGQPNHVPHLSPVMKGAALRDTYEARAFQLLKMLINIVHRLLREHRLALHAERIMRRPGLDCEQESPYEVHITNHLTPLSGLCRFLSKVVGTSHLQPIPEVQ